MGYLLTFAFPNIILKMAYTGRISFHQFKLPPVRTLFYTSLSLAIGGISFSQNSNATIANGLKEALSIGVKNAVALTSVKNGFFDNANIRLPFPEDAIKVKEFALKAGLKKQVDEFERVLNNAAEEATKTALPIFSNAIKNISIQDGVSVLKGGEGAATNFLKEKTRAQLVEAFSPKVKEAISKVKLTSYWQPLSSKYNATVGKMSFLGAKPVSTDLSAYVTDKAIDGLFYMVAQEENKIRKDPAARATQLLKKVFGSK